MTAAVDPGPGAIRCSAIAASLEEPLYGTASVVRNWVLVEQPGPWGHEAPMQSRMPRSLARWLRARSADLGLRVVLLRRTGGGETHGGRHVYVARTDPRQAWFEHAELDDVRALVDVDLSPLASGAPVGLGHRETRPLFLVCTNGRRDPCCAERGRPLARAIAAVAGDRAWECSHIGGDRFAGNVVCFPHGVYMGRVNPAAARSLVGDYESGLVDLDLYRGRSCYDFATQAGDHFVRRRFGLRRIDDLALIHRIEGPPGTVMVAFSGPSGSTHRVVVRSVPADVARPLTCHADQPSRPRTFVVADAIDQGPFDT